ncbi:hypothetical protein [Actinacidiphila glaucinigra]|uniref:Uncharacterized protein n=1 Tax=Actinacidiphila glaucinigra TaxID=235986 RepID=A0A239E8U2_9ACTN|nr:hypothetical protein [Actinacidiphila glaucinigra]SNS40909.1 hypothetical protein SAMN05216252_105373 [Actinacidiphila glaucinigra]
MSDDVLSVIPTDPRWQPGRDAAERAAALVASLEPGDPDGADVEIEVSRYDTVMPVDCGGNLAAIGCPLCGGSVDTRWWADLLEAHADEGFETLAVDVPCCGGATSLDALRHDWPCGFARFEIAVWNPARDWFGAHELAALGEALGHPVRQIRARV